MSLDILRIISMAMIICLHFINKSPALGDITTITANYHLEAILSCIALICVNCFVLITGYFGEQSKFKLSKLVALIAEVWFYSVIIYALLVITKQIPFGLKDTFTSIFPILTRQYWFITNYIGLYLIAPIIKAFVKNINKEMFTLVVIVGMLILVVYYNLFFLWENLNFGGATGIVWFTYLYLVGIYLKRYPLKTSTKTNVIIYIVMLVLALLSRYIFVLGYLVTKKGILLQGAPVFSSVYNSIMIFLCSVAFFNIFANAKIELNGIATKIVKILVASSFSVYLIHDNPFLCTMVWDNLTKYHQNPIMNVLNLLLCIVVIYLGATVIDLVRQFIFSKTITSKKANELFKNIENKIVEISKNIYSKINSLTNN